MKIIWFLCGYSQSNPNSKEVTRVCNIIFEISKDKINVMSSFSPPSMKSFTVLKLHFNWLRKSCQNCKITELTIHMSNNLHLPVLWCLLTVKLHLSWAQDTSNKPNLAPKWGTVPSCWQGHRLPAKYLLACFCYFGMLAITDQIKMRHPCNWSKIYKLC